MCEHNQFRANVKVQRYFGTLTIAPRIVAELTVQCVECGMDFVFVNDPAIEDGRGVPQLSSDMKMASLPIKEPDAALERITVTELAESWSKKFT